MSFPFQAIYFLLTVSFLCDKIHCVVLISPSDGMADMADSKSAPSNWVGVRVPSRASEKTYFSLRGKYVFSDADKVWYYEYRISALIN